MPPPAANTKIFCPFLTQIGTGGGGGGGGGGGELGLNLSMLVVPH